MFTTGFADPQPLPAPSELGAGTEPEPEGGQRDDQATVSDEVNTMLMALLPWGISALFHAGLVLLAVFLVWSTVRRNLGDDQEIIPSIRLSPTPGAPLQLKTKERTETSRARRTVAKIARPTAMLSSPVETPIALIGVKGASGKAAPFGTNVGSGVEFGTNFIGLGGNAKNIAFLIDASGSLIDTFQIVILELKRTIQKLSEKQSFTVIFFQGDDIIEVPPRGLKQATTENKARIIEWIDPASHNVQAGGSTNPVKALRIALRYRAQLMFILSDNITGQDKYEIDQRRLLAEIDRANSAQTKINTIQFLYPDPLTKVGLRGTMELIAERSGGKYKFVDGRELNIE